MTIGGIQAFIQYLRSFTQPITQMASISSQVQRTMAAAERIFNFLDEPEHWSKSTEIHRGKQQYPRRHSL